MSSRSIARLFLIVLIARLRLDVSGLVVDVRDELVALCLHRLCGHGGGAGQLPDLEVDPAVELLAFPAGVGADRAVGPDGHDLPPSPPAARAHRELVYRPGAAPGPQ